jgi:hypothetical protein
MLLIESMAFKNGNKWRMNDGTAAYYALVENQEFFDKIDAGGGGAIREGRRPGRRSTAELAGRSGDLRGFNDAVGIVGHGDAGMLRLRTIPRAVWALVARVAHPTRFMDLSPLSLAVSEKNRQPV